MKAVWPGQPGGYEPTVWKDMVKYAAMKEKMKAAHKKQTFYTNVKDAQDAAAKRRT